jgi:hypothetical protein
VHSSSFQSLLLIPDFILSEMQIKKAEVGKGAPEGSYRATFEDKILMSDIVFCRTWATVTPKDYYNPVLLS